MDALLAVLDAHGVLYVVTGSVAALLRGVQLEPGDLDVTPSLDAENLRRLTRADLVMLARLGQALARSRVMPLAA